MGKIKSLMIKKASKQLIEKDKKFNESFEDNKNKLGSTMPSKKVRNKIAGYIARLKKMEREALKPKPKVVQDIQSEVSSSY